LGVFSQSRDGRFALAGLGTWLLTDKQGSLRGSAIAGGEQRFVAYGSLLRAVETGESVDRLYSRFDDCFDVEIAWSTRRAAHSIVSAYDFSSFHTVADIGGGHGALIAALLNDCPSLSGVLFDRPQVISGARSYLENAGVAARCRIIGGDFFDSIQCSADALILKNIIHNWDDERSTAILRNCAKTLGKGGKVLLVERILPAQVEDDFDAIWMDLSMLAYSRGRERTESEYRNLLASAGFEFTRAIPTWSQLWVIEGQVRDGIRGLN
jgi:SAM-dependent methyltransferase